MNRPSPRYPRSRMVRERAPEKYAIPERGAPDERAVSRQHCRPALTIAVTGVARVVPQPGLVRRRDEVVLRLRSSWPRSSSLVGKGADYSEIERSARMGVLELTDGTREAAPLVSGANSVAAVDPATSPRVGVAAPPRTATSSLTSWAVAGLRC